MKLTAMCFYVPGEKSIVDTARTDGRSTVYGETLDEIRLRYPGAQLLPWREASDAVDKAQAECYKIGEPESCTAEKWWYALEVLPPCRWTRNATGQAFFVSELVCGKIADWYINKGDRYWHMYNYTNANVDEMLAVCQ